jgi:hypothetical protein
MVLRSVLYTWLGELSVVSLLLYGRDPPLAARLNPLCFGLRACTTKLTQHDLKLPCLASLDRYPAVAARTRPLRGFARSGSLSMSSRTPLPQSHETRRADEGYEFSADRQPFLSQATL